MKRISKKIFLSLMCLTTLFTTSTYTTNLEACTGLQLNAKDGTHVNGRTLEFGVKIDITVTVVPRGYVFEGTTPEGKGLKYISKYGAVGAVAFTTPALMDGLNEKGLAVGTFYFPGFADYSKITPENQAKALSPVEFPNWILTQFATIEEVKAAINDVVIAPTVVKEWGPVAAPFHYIVYDKSGKSLVIEPLDGKLVVTDNPIGVFTNSPKFDWHLTNLRNYINLREINVPPLKINGFELASFGQGSGMVGLPGDFTPPSRFVQAAVFFATAIPSETAEESIFQLFHILNHFDIPVGVARSVENGITYSDSTLITVAKDPQALKYYYKTFTEQVVKVVDLKKFDLDAKELKKLPLDNEKSNAIDVTGNFKF